MIPTTTALLKRFQETETFSSSTTLISSTTTIIPTATPSPLLPPAEIQIYDSWALLLLVSLLLCTLMTAYFLQVRKIRAVHETVLAIVLGLFVGLILRLIPGSWNERISTLVGFDHRLFFNVLLPPIILNSGYELEMENFFRNLGSILIFAFLGTLTSSLIVALSIFLFSKTPLVGLTMNFLDCFLFGAILSSTDPVTVLAIFKQLKVDPKLYSLIFGESILNDSVAIVLFGTLDHFRGKPFTAGTFFGGMGLFLSVFFGSVVVGVALALGCALLLKFTQLNKFPALETSVLTLLAYSSYLFANALKLSGIVSLLFFGITAKHYAYRNLSARSKRSTRYMFRVLGQLSEMFIFVYLGLTVFTTRDKVFLPGLIVFTLFILFIARYLSIIPYAWMINGAVKVRRNRQRRQRLARYDDPMVHEASLDDGEPPPPRPPPSLRPIKDKIPRNYQLMMFWAGLRGAISFALSYELELGTDENDPAKERAESALRTTTLLVCVISILIMGSTTVWMLQVLKISMGVGQVKDEEGDSTDEEDEGIMLDDEIEEYLDSIEDDDASPRVSQPGVHSARHWLIAFDNQWLKPLFLKNVEAREPRMDFVPNLTNPEPRMSVRRSKPSIPNASEEEFLGPDGNPWQSRSSSTNEL